MLTYIDWPQDLWNLEDVSYRLTSESSSYGPGYNRRSTVYFTENRTWQITATISQIWDDQVPLHRSFINSIRGRSSVLRIPVCNLFHEIGEGTEEEFWRRIGVTETEISDGFERYTDDTHFTDGTGFALPSRDNPTVGADAEVGDVSIQVRGDMVSFMEVGALFSIDNFLYEVESNHSTYITFHPPLRQSVLSGTEISYKEPHILVRLSDDNVGFITENASRKSPSVSVSFEEVFHR